MPDKRILPLFGAMNGSAGLSLASGFQQHRPMQPDSTRNSGCPFQFHDERLRILWDHWYSLCQGDIPPCRDDIDPGKLRKVLPLTWIYRKHRDREEFYCSLAGDEVIRAWNGRRMIGVECTDLFAPDAWAVLRARWMTVLTTPAVQYSEGAPQLLVGSARYKRAERLTLPLLHRDGAPYGVIGATRYSYDPIDEAHLAVSPPTSSIIVPLSQI